MFTKAHHNLGQLVCLSLLALFFLSEDVIASDSKVRAYPYAVKAGVKNGDYSFSIPIRANESPIVEVYQSNGRFDSVVRDKDIHFKTGFSVQCGKKWKLKGDPTIKVYGKDENLIAQNLGVRKADSNYAYMGSRLNNFETTKSLSPQEACNNVIDDRTNADLPIASLLKKGYWTKIDRAYEASLSYSCKSTKRRTFSEPDRFRTLTDWQPLFVHCLADPDYGKEYAKTSKNTSTSSASHADIKKALDKKEEARNKEKQKNRKNPTDKSKRANPVNPAVPIKRNLKYQALINKGDQERVVSPPKTLEDFLEYGGRMASKRKMRLVDFEIVSLSGSQAYYIGLWQKGSGTSLMNKPLGMAKFDKLHQENLNKGLQLADFELVDSGSGRRVASLWKTGNMHEKFSHDMSLKEFKQRNVKLNKRDFYPMDMELFLKAGKIRYTAIWRRSSGDSQAQFMPALESKEFRKTRDKLVAKGKQLKDIERIEKGGKTYISGLWVNGNGPSGFSKPRGIDKFKKFIGAKDRFIDEIEVHLGGE